MVVVKFPRRERAVGCEAALHLDDASRTKIGPSEFFFASPYDFHGRPAARDKRAASSAASLVCFLPYAEPVSGTITRTLLSGIWNTAARSSRTAKGRCVPVQTVSFPSVHSATAARGSSGACAI